jgi:aldose 1-epimerase
LDTDNAYLVNREQNGPYDWRDAPVARVQSAWSGIQLDIFSDQEAFQVYSCNFMSGTFPLTPRYQ